MDVLVSEGETDLVVDLADSPDPVLTGDPLRYTVTVTNAGPDPALVPALVLTLGAGTSYDLAGGDGWSCDAALGVVTCTRETLPPGSSSVAVFTTAPAAGGIVTATVDVSADNDPFLANNADSEDTVVVDDVMTDLAVFKDDGGIPATPGEEMVYSITVTNQGPNPADGAIVTDYFPASLDSILWECVATVGSRCTDQGSGDIVDFVLLQPYGTLLYTASAWVYEDATGEILNTAIVEPPPSMSDYYAPNDTSPVRAIVGLIFQDGFESGDVTRWSYAEANDEVLVDCLAGSRTAEQVEQCRFIE
ncbi:MAG: DUF11 domain-containing protein [bacterium]|nr:DUF11 domain-containing protein [bacterium]